MRKLCKLLDITGYLVHETYPILLSLIIHLFQRYRPCLHPKMICAKFRRNRHSGPGNVENVKGFQIDSKADGRTSGYGVNAIKRVLLNPKRNDALQYM